MSPVAGAGRARAWTLGAGLAFVVLSTARPASAADATCPTDVSVAPAAPSTGEVSTSRRLRFITANLDLGARRALAWSLGWGITYGAAAVTLFAVTPFVSPGLRKDLYVGAASATIGAITRSVSRPAVIRERRRLRRIIAAEGTSCEALHAAERALARSARWEHRNRRLLLHLAALTYNAGVGLVLGLGLDRPLSGIRQAAVGAVVGQVMFVTQPMTSARALTRYQAGFVGPTGARVHSLPWLVPGGGGGLRVMGRF